MSNEYKNMTANDHKALGSLLDRIVAKREARRKNPGHQPLTDKENIMSNHTDKIDTEQLNEVLDDIQRMARRVAIMIGQAEIVNRLTHRPVEHQSAVSKMTNELSDIKSDLFSVPQSKAFREFDRHLDKVRVDLSNFKSIR